MSDIHKRLTRNFGFVREEVVEGNHETPAYFGKGTVLHDPNSNLSVVVLARNEQELREFFKTWLKGIERDPTTPLNLDHVYPLALVHESALKMKDEEL
jgi:hypothetical protein